MGYKLAGFDVIGGVELDPTMMRLYRANLKPRESHLGDIRSAPLPSASIDVVDGSPPCTTFSTAGLREKTWGKIRAYREGKHEQRLDDLVFVFAEYALRIAPKVIVLENVLGLARGKARYYLQRICSILKNSGYTVQVFTLCGHHYGLAQLRPRLFIIANRTRKTLRLPPFWQPRYPGDVIPESSYGKPLSPFYTARWGLNFPQTRLMRVGGGGRINKLHPRKLAPTLCARSTFAHWDRPCEISDAAYARLQSFPDDYQTLGKEVNYVCGMSVAPFVAYVLGTAIIRDLL